MDSRSPPAEAALRRRLWLPAIVLWTAFLGATLGLFVTLLLLPAAASQALDWHALSLLFM
jgi:hypothetical protein